MADLVRVDMTEGGRVATLTLDRPEHRNPTSLALLESLDAALDQATGEPRLHVLCLAGAGRSFCAGLDLGEVIGDETTVHKLLGRLSAVMRRLRRLPVATIALVQGAAIGGGFGFMAVCDLRLTHPESKIGYPPLSTGLSPALMSPWLIRLVGPGRARARLMLGGTMTGREAYELGIATHLVDAAAIPGTADALTDELLTGGRYAMTEMKSLLNELDGSLADPPLDRASDVSARVIAHEETQTRLRSQFGDHAAAKG